MGLPAVALLRRLRGSAEQLLESGSRARWRRLPLDGDTVFYESFNGNGVLCSPEALFRRLHGDPRFARLRHIWSLSDENDNAAIHSEFDGDSRVVFVSPGSAAYERALLTSHYLISNATFGRQFAKRPDQFYVNTWHGTPLKKMGFDIGDPAARVANVMRNFLHADILVSPNPFTTETLYRRAHRLDAIYGGRILESGYPRIDRQLDGSTNGDDSGTPEDRRLEAGRAGRAILDSRGLGLGGRDVVLWAPTWKGKSFAQPENDAAELLATVRDLQSRLDPARFVVLLKTHQVVHRFAARDDEATTILVPNDIPSNVVLAAASTLVTDYSSIVFDYLCLDRPIVFYTPDIADYAGYRGLYLEPDVWPGPVVTTLADTASEIDRLSDLEADLAAGLEADAPGRLGSRHAALRERMSPFDDGRATERVIAAMFDRAEPTPPQGRPRLLLALPSNVGDARLREAVDLVNALDHDVLDVSVVLSDSRRARYLAAQGQLDPRVRRFVRQGMLESTPRAWFRRRIENRRGRASAHADVASLRRLWDHEWHRLFADVAFDVVADLVAAEPFWLTLLLHATPPTGHRPVTAVWRDPRTARGPAVDGLLAQYDETIDSDSPQLAAEFLSRLPAVS